ncbi:PREDICTED: lisH domain and HEAT repeat-containing protein KIAA1468 homolog [Tarenaya hassleriana]|uniref:lisH domain and HEAT repeat-containing protein KIAA1468 homolog n=1 Tax=Tarenaya hassleriana TaxID=28532 RepID=UPI00053C7C58|nr:PREDICTED: lisH domain and HEAT repeat-containing protein KIAA1468 homolog [Tarenaya hassleriana]
MNAERSSLCNFVVNFLLEENYLLTAFELLHELLDDGRDAQAIRLKDFFSDPSRFPPDQISRYNSLRVADPQSLLEEKEKLAEKLAISEYELRLAQEDITKLKTEVQKKSDPPIDRLEELNSDECGDSRPEIQRKKKDKSFTDLGPLKNKERRDLNCAVKEYLLLAGYRLTAMTFYEEVTDQNLDVWQDTPACVSDALRHYYYQYLSSTSEAAEEKITMLRTNELLKKENERLNKEKDEFLKIKDVSEGQISSLTKSIESLQKDLRDKEKQVQSLKQLLENQRRNLNDTRAEITALKMHIEGSRSDQYLAANEVDPVQSQCVDKGAEEADSFPKEVETPAAEIVGGLISEDSISVAKEHMGTKDDLVEEEVKNMIPDPVDVAPEVNNGSDEVLDRSPKNQTQDSKELLTSLSNGSISPKDCESILKLDSGTGRGSDLKSDNANSEASSEKMGLGTIQILADALPKIVPYVLINHREELLPLMMCAIERHPASGTRDSLTHTLFNLIKRPDEQQRRVIMDACVSLAKNVGEMRTETELLPQCWEQINHSYEERRLLVAQSCGELAEYVRPEIRDSLILSIVQQLVEDSATVVREAAARNLALLLPLFPNADKYFKVEEMMFQLICDPSGLVVETTLKELLPAVIKWGNKLDHILRILLSHAVSSAQHCPPLSGVEGSVESHLRVLGERERWNIDVLLRMLMELLPVVHQKAIETCPLTSIIKSEDTAFSVSLLERYAEGHSEWPMFEWMHVGCFANLLQLACMLPQKEDHLRNRITKFLLAVSVRFGESYLTHIEIPVFLMAVGEEADIRFLPSAIHPRIKGLRPRTAVADRLATLCVLPLLLAGVLGAPSKREELANFLRKILVEDKIKEDQSSAHSSEILDAVRYLCTFEEHHSMIFNILWEIVVSSNAELKINAAKLLKTIVPYIDEKVATTHVLPALVTLGSDQNLNVKYASIDAFGAVAQHFKVDMIVDKIRVQMDAFLEDGSHEATIAVVRALLVAIPHTTEQLREYLLSKIFQLSASPSSTTDVMRRRERANAFCEAIRALDATDMSGASVREYLLPAIQNLLKDPDALDPAHKEAIEIIMKERSGGTLEAIGKVMVGAHLGIASSVTSFFGEGSGLLGKRDTSESAAAPSGQGPESPKAAPQAEDTRFRRIMRGNFTDMLRGKGQ